MALRQTQAKTALAHCIRRGRVCCSLTATQTELRSVEYMKLGYHAEAVTVVAEIALTYIQISLRWDRK